MCKKSGKFCWFSWIILKYVILWFFCCCANLPISFSINNVSESFMWVVPKSLPLKTALLMFMDLVLCNYNIPTTHDMRNGKTPIHFKKWFYACVCRQRTYRVVLSDHNISQHEGKEQYISVSHVHIYPNWNSYTISNLQKKYHCFGACNSSTC